MPISGFVLLGAVAILVVAVASILGGGGGRQALGVSAGPLVSPTILPTGAPASSVQPSTAAGGPSASPETSPTRPPADVALGYPAGCVAYHLSPRRCAYIVDWAGAQAGAASDGTTFLLLGDPDCPGQQTVCSARLGGGSFVVRVRVVAPDGSSSDRSVFCGFASQSSPLCSDSPLIRVSSPMNGYHDTPCQGEGGSPGSTCATPPPPIAPDGAAGAVALRVPSLVVPIDHVGPYSIDVGTAVLANGILRDATATLADDRRSDLLVPDGVQLQVVGKDGKPIFNVYQHPWHRGTETVHVRLVFTVASDDAPTTLEFTDIVVR